MVSDSSDTENVELPGHGLIQTVVIVDSPQITKPVAQFLRQVGWTVYEASNCGQARGLISRYKPEFVIMELLLPLETGFEFCAYLKKMDCKIPVMIFSEVWLEEARNLAMWAGADAFLTKPTDPNRLYQQILAAAQRVSYRVRAAETGMSGSITFRCKCGKSLRVGSQHAGRGIVCPGCQHLAKCPDSLLDSATLFRSLMEERLGVRTNHTGIVCSNCQMTVDPRQCRVKDHYECLHCGVRLKVAADFLEQWQLFFDDQSAAPPVTDFNPLRYVFVQCDECRNLHRYFRDADNPQPCPSCGHQHSLPSIRGIPISRAALASTGRLFEFRLLDGKSKLFLLPSRRKWMVGSAADCPITLRNQPLLPKHCILRNTIEGPVIIPAVREARIRVNNRPVTEQTLLQPGDEVHLGEVPLVLQGTPIKQLNRRLAGVMNEVTDRQRSVGELEMAEPAAKILQYHWELQRVNWIDYLRQQNQGLSSESSLIQPIDAEGLQ